MTVWNLKRISVKDIAYVSLVGINKISPNELGICGVGTDIGIIINGALCSIDGKNNLLKRCNMLERDPKTGLYNGDLLSLGDICAIEERRIWGDNESNISFQQAREIITEARKKIEERNGMMYSSDFLGEPTPTSNKGRYKARKFINGKRVINL